MTTKEMIKEVNEAHDRVSTIGVTEEDIRKSVIQIAEIFSDFLTEYDQGEQHLREIALEKLEKANKQ